MQGSLVSKAFSFWEGFYDDCQDKRTNKTAHPYVAERLNVRLARRPSCCPCLPFHACACDVSALHGFRKGRDHAPPFLYLARTRCFWERLVVAQDPEVTRRVEVPC